MKFDYDLICIGLGPAGMAVSIMAAEMGLSVCAIEKNRIGGECMNVGCIPSKALLRMAKARHAASHLEEMELESVPALAVRAPFARIRDHLQYINDKKTVSMFAKVHLILSQGAATFVDPQRVRVGEKTLSARRIFICTGTHPALPPIPGLAEVEDILTNENMFALDQVPESLVILGGGAIGAEMAQAFSRLGSKVALVHADAHLVPAGDPEAGELLRQTFEAEGIRVFNGRQIERISRSGSEILLTTKEGDDIRGARLLVAAGRKPASGTLDLAAAAGIETDERGFIRVNRFLQTSRPNIFAVGDCNGHALFSHAAMHQGMIAIMNSMMPWPFRQDFRKYLVPWTVFTDPPVSAAGRSEAILRKEGVAFETIRINYGDYGAAIAENVGTGFVKAFVGTTGRIFGVVIVGEGSGEMINEWALAIQKGLRMHDLLFLQHSFPTMGFLSKRVSESWMMNRMKSERLKGLCQFLFRH